VRAGGCVGYGRTYVAPEPARIAIVPVGYADGYPYQASNRADVLIRGHRCPIRGTVCMDQIAADVTALPACEIGDPVVLIGSDGDERIDERELARHAQTIPYDILTGLGVRVTREYIE
jgi:alanine racemase